MRPPVTVHRGAPGLGHDAATGEAVGSELARVVATRILGGLAQVEPVVATPAPRVKVPLVVPIYRRLCVQPEAASCVFQHPHTSQSSIETFIEMQIVFGDYLYCRSSKVLGGLAEVEPVVATAAPRVQLLHI